MTPVHLFHTCSDLFPEQVTARRNAEFSVFSLFKQPVPRKTATPSFFQRRLNKGCLESLYIVTLTVSLNTKFHRQAQIRVFGDEKLGRIFAFFRNRLQNMQNLAFLSRKNAFTCSGNRLEQVGTGGTW